MHSQLDLSLNDIGGYNDWSQGGKLISTPEGPKAIADALLVHASLTALDVCYNGLGKEGKALLQQAVQGRSGFDLKM